MPANGIDAPTRVIGSDSLAAIRPFVPLLWLCRILLRQPATNCIVKCTLDVFLHRSRIDVVVRDEANGLNAPMRTNMVENLLPVKLTRLCQFLPLERIGFQRLGASLNDIPALDMPLPNPSLMGYEPNSHDSKYKCGDC